ncbi:uncharacterized protein LOC110696371 [Chenopodium quinoa]|uniref:uncharacterized protein LOC110696371 n=1 Tax=Chenopodium quinoa TaxID=63459 RepID=UPI000B7758D1|nr:uncharacterized protein LOC110696371 [Chenopodium quinoa]
MVPKVGNASKVSQFRPIACCNVLYKVIARMICSRLKEILPGLISEVQSAFVAGRSILDNILICQDVLKGYKDKQKAPRCTIKVDLRKAYDSINWDFIRDMLTALKFPAELLRKVGSMRSFKFHSRCKMLNLNHLAFTDDLILFCYGDKKYVSLLVKALSTFEKCSGLQASAEKTAIYFGNVARVVKQEILRVSGFVEGCTPFKYLGIPLNVRSLSNSDYDSLIDKMLARITCWSSRNLSYAARCLLVNTVLLSLHTY